MGRVMEENIIKSKERVQKHGEVFTPSWMVQKMLDTPGIREKTADIYATFLEPSAGDGNFLEAILQRKLSAVTRNYDKKNWKTKYHQFMELNILKIILKLLVQECFCIILIGLRKHLEKG